MAIQDSSPERRNLLVMAMGVIIFYVGGGSIATKSLSLQVISIEFRNVEALVVLFWLAFLWFLYRYWVVHRSSFQEEFPVELNEYRSVGIVRDFVESRIGHELAPIVGDPKERATGFEIEWLRIRNWVLTARVLERTLTRNDEGVISGRGSIQGGNHSFVGFQGLLGWTAAAWILLRCTFTRPSFTSYLFPYLLAVVAIVLGLSDLISGWINESRALT